MNKIEIKPNIINHHTLTSGAMAILSSVSLIIFYFFYIKHLNLSFEYIELFMVALLIPWIMFGSSIINSSERFIIVDKNLVYFKTRSKLGLGKWKTKIVLDFSKITLVEEKAKRVFNGHMITTKYWLSFENEDGVKTQILLNEWGSSSIKNLFSHLRNSHPTVRFNTFF